MRSTGHATIDYFLSITISLPKKDAILNSKTNQQSLTSVLSTSKSGREYYDGAFGHDEADITMVSCAMLQATENM